MWREAINDIIRNEMKMMKYENERKAIMIMVMKANGNILV